eukprot:gnl/Chilomastix_cuspidata/613.p1 GENE.gnl/Chilomastix_cuspidata/613~~gnl/Chilomastix_cuspidata/613.p1  ORF type:complete len:932 (+),score=458.89 gnl/Chilomastix_cuspidata/613:4496-7291(+)
MVIRVKEQMRLPSSLVNVFGSVSAGGNVLFSPDGNSLFATAANRVILTELTKGVSSALPFEARKNIRFMTVSPNASLLVTFDVDGYSCFFDLINERLSFRMNFRGKVRAAVFTPDSRFLVVLVGRAVQIWEVTRGGDFEVQLARKHVMPSEATCVAVAADSRTIAVGTQAGDVRLFSAPGVRGRSVVLSGHRTGVLAVGFLAGGDIVSVSQDASLFRWREGAFEGDALPGGIGRTTKQKGGVYHTVARAFFTKDSEAHARKIREREGIADSVRFRNKRAQLATCAALSGANSGILALGFESGVFAIYSFETPDSDVPQLVHTMSASRLPLVSVAAGADGLWVAVKCSGASFTVWEWQSESKVHYVTPAATPKSVVHSPDGLLIAAAGDDGIIRVFDARTGAERVRFEGHIGPAAVCFLPTSRGLVSAGRDGTVRGYDLSSGKEFRVMEAPDRPAFSAVAVDPTSSIVAAACARHPFSICTFELRTGRFLDALDGHEGPLAGLCFPADPPLLVSASWDGYVVAWDIYGAHGGSHEPVKFASPLTAVTAVGGLAAIASSDGDVSLLDIQDGQVLCRADIRRDIAGGRYDGDARSWLSMERLFATSLALSGDASMLIVGGFSKWALVYAVTGTARGRKLTLVRKFQLTHNRALSGVLELLPGTARGAGDDEEDSDELSKRIRHRTVSRQRRAMKSGIEATDLARRTKEIQTFSISCAPDGAGFVCSTPVGLLGFGTRRNPLGWDPLDLEPEITPARALELLESRPETALAMALRLGVPALGQQVLEGIAPDRVYFVVRAFPAAYLARLVAFLAAYAAASPRLGLALEWACQLLRHRFDDISAAPAGVSESMRALQRSVAARSATLRSLFGRNETQMLALLKAAAAPAPDAFEGEIGEIHAQQLEEAQVRAAADEARRERRDEEQLRRFKRRRYR